MPMHVYIYILMGYFPTHILRGVSVKSFRPLTLAFCHWIWIWIFSSFQDQTCRAMIDPRSSGYCECGGGRIIRKPGCTHGEWAEPFTCHDECAGWGFQKDGMMWKMKFFLRICFHKKTFLETKDVYRWYPWMYKYWFPGFGFDSGPNLQPWWRIENQGVYML